MSTKYSSDKYKSAWKGRTLTLTKDWGEEILMGSLHQIHAKVLLIDAGSSTSLKYYANKNEVLFVRHGKATIEYSTEEYLHYPELAPLVTTHLQMGDVFFVQSGCPYKILAQSNCEIFEIGDNSNSLPIKLNQESEQR